jgi:predicted nuclease of predicted toxin-antitoxin system
LIKLIADENIPLETVDLLKNNGVDIISISNTLRGLKDRDVLQVANAENRLLITFDHDFAQLVFKEKRQTRGIILLMFTPKSPQHIAKRILQVLSKKLVMTNMFVTVRADHIKVTRAK